MSKKITIIFLFISLVVQAQDPSVAKFKAAFLYHFTKYIEWPPSKKQGDFVVCIFGDNDVFREMEVVSRIKKMIGSQTLILKKCSKVSDVVDCNILFVGEDVSDELESLSNKYKKTGVLITADFKGANKKGACTEFKVKDEKLGFEINTSNCETNGLTIANQLVLMSSK